MKPTRYEWTTSYVEAETQKFTDDLNKMSADGWEIYALLPFAACNNEMSDFVSIVARREIPVPGPLPAEEPVVKCSDCGYNVEITNRYQTSKGAVLHLECAARLGLLTRDPTPAEETVEVPRCTLCNHAYGVTVLGCSACGENVCTSCARQVDGLPFHPACDPREAVR